MPAGPLHGVTIQLSTERDPVSAAIRYFTRSDFSHVDFVLSAGLRLPDGTISKGGELLGARSSGGVQVRSSNYANFSRTERYLAPLAPIGVLEYAISQVGKPYDYRGIVNFFLQRNWRDDDSWFCSEMVAASFERAWKPLIIVPDCDRVTPRDLTLSTRLLKLRAGEGCVGAKGVGA